MNFGYCMICNKLISYYKYNVCDECNLKCFNLVRDYINDHGKSTIKDIQENTNVPKKLISKYYEEGILFDDDLDITEEEKRRQNNINNLNSINNLFKEQLENKGVKMHYLNRKKK